MKTYMALAGLIYKQVGLLNFVYAAWLWGNDTNVVKPSFSFSCRSAWILSGSFFVGVSFLYFLCACWRTKVTRWGATIWLGWDTLMKGMSPLSNMAARGTPFRLDLTIWVCLAALTSAVTWYRTCCRTFFRFSRVKASAGLDMLRKAKLVPAFSASSPQDSSLWFDWGCCFCSEGLVNGQGREKLKASYACCFETFQLLKTPFLKFGIKDRLIL